MLAKYSYNFLLILLLAFSQLAPAKGFQEPKSRDVLVRESIAKLDSDDLHVAAQAATDLGALRATEAVPTLLRVLKSSRLLQTTEHVISKDKSSLSFWVSTDVRAAIINSLGLIGDKRAVPALEKYLKRPLKNRDVFTGTVAGALYQITGKSYVYKDFDGVEKLYEPSPIDEEEFRKRARPDLKATAGLTASLEIEGHDSSGTYWTGNKRLKISFAITNQSNRPIEIDASNNNFVFSSVSTERTLTAASLLPSPQPSDAGLAVIAPGQKLQLMWEVELKESPLSRGWREGYVNIKCVYTNPQKHKRGQMWRGEQLTSNSVERFYYPSGVVAPAPNSQQS